jgi:hypothetical protein
VQRRASNSGVIMVCGSLGRAHKHQTLTIWVSETTGDRARRRGNPCGPAHHTLPIRNIKADRLQTASGVEKLAD